MNELARYTTMGIGGACKTLKTARTANELIDSFGAMVLGGGSNVLVSDDGVDGTVVLNRFADFASDGNVVVAGSGMRLPELCKRLEVLSLGGMEWAAGIPASVGGAILTNAGAFGGEISDRLLYADVVRGGNVVRLSPRELGLSYRKSELLPSDIVLRAAFELERTSSREIERKMRGFAARRNATQPKARSAGSVFKNPDGVSIARVIDGLGFKGYRSGGAKISERHANFIVNEGGARAKDVCAIINTVKSALSEIGITACEEIVYVGEF